MLTCFTDWIGIKTCVVTEPESGVFLNELPGINLENIEQIADSDQVTYANVWNDVQARAIKKFNSDIITEFGKRFRLRRSTQTVDLSKFIDKTSITPAAAKYRGFTIELNQSTDQFVYSNLQAINIQELKLYFTAAVTLDVKVFDLDTGEELFTKSVTGVLNEWLKISINQVFMARRVFVCYDATALGGVNLDLTKFRLDSFGLGCSSCSCDSIDYGWLLGWGFCGCQSRVRGAESDISAEVTDVTQSSNTTGLSGIFSVRCEYDRVVCNNKELFTTALWYLLGAELMTERIFSDRVNRFTSVDLKKAHELKTYFEFMYKGGVDAAGTFHDGDLQRAVYGVQLNPADCCLQCDGAIRFLDSQM